MTDERPAYDESSVECTEAWKAFGSDTEAGRLLKKLYCGNAKPKIAYPKIKVKPRDALTTAPFIPCGGSVNTDSRTHQMSTKISDRAIKAPTFSKRHGTEPEVFPIDYAVGRKKPFKEIEKEVNQIKKQMDAYRMSSIRRQPNQEKEKLQQVFSYTAGSILPRELLPGSELLSRELSHANAQRNGKYSNKDRLAQLEELYDAVLGEVEARKGYIAEMISLGRPEKAASVEHEILERMSELRKIHQLILKEKCQNNNDSAD